MKRIIKLVVIFYTLSILMVCNVHAQEYEYDELGRLISVIDDNGQVYVYVYDARSNIISEGAEDMFNSNRAKSIKINDIFVDISSDGDYVIKFSKRSYPIDFLVSVETVSPYAQYEIDSIYKNKSVSVTVTSRDESEYIYNISVRYKEDVDYNNTIDLLDLIDVSKSYGVINSQEEYSSNLDINNDNIINIFDLVLVSSCIE